jgi:hypothetical protein
MIMFSSFNARLASGAERTSELQKMAPGIKKLGVTADGKFKRMRPSMARVGGSETRLIQPRECTYSLNGETLGFRMDWGLARTQLSKSPRH